MTTRILDITTDFNADNGKKLDVAGWQEATLSFVNPTGTISIQGTNDAGAVTGVTDGNATSSTNYTAIQATNLATGSAVTSVAAAGNYKITIGTRFIQAGGASAAADKVFVFLHRNN